MKIELDFTHTLSMDEVKRRLDARARHWAKKKPSLGIDDAYRWVTPTRAEGTARGGKGWVELSDGHVRLGGDLPFFARPFRERIESFLRSEAEVVISGELER